MSESPLPDGVGLTALITAYARAQESRLPDRLFNDPLAELFIVAAVGREDIAARSLPRLGPARQDGSSGLWNSLYGYFSGRTPFYDHYLNARVADGTRQIVLIGAGLDARAHRLPLPSDATVFEIDSAGVLDFKAAVLARHGLESAPRRVPVVADLREDWVHALIGSGFAPAEPTAWLAEGLFMYFTPGEADKLLSEIDVVSAPFSTLAGEYLDRRTKLTDVAVSDDGDRAVAELFIAADRGGPDADPTTWLAKQGWVGNAKDFVAELGELNREVPHLFDDTRPDPLKLSLFTATKP